MCPVVVDSCTLTRYKLIFEVIIFPFSINAYANQLASFWNLLTKLFAFSFKIYECEGIICCSFIADDQNKWEYESRCDVYSTDKYFLIIYYMALKGLLPILQRLLKFFRIVIWHYFWWQAALRLSALLKKIVFHYGWYYGQFLI